jgi:hypothetical protein
MEGYSVRHIVIPAIGLFALITLSPLIAGRWAIPDQDVAQLGGFEGDNARVVMAGHTPGVFDGLHTLHEGDWILLTGPQGTTRYYVDWIEYRPDNAVWWPDAETEGELMIITCEGEGRRIIGAMRAE